jgi:hypothetical protein
MFTPIEPDSHCILRCMHVMVSLSMSLRLSYVSRKYNAHLSSRRSRLMSYRFVCNCPNVVVIIISDMKKKKKQYTNFSCSSFSGDGAKSETSEPSDRSTATVTLLGSPLIPSSYCSTYRLISRSYPSHLFSKAFSSRTLRRSPLFTS